MGDARLSILILPVCLCGLMVAATLAGRRLAAARARHGDGGQPVGIGAIDAAVLGLLGLLIAFWFSSAGTRLDMRRNLILEESNAVGTAWLRLALLPEDVQPAMRRLFCRYLDVRLEQAPSERSDASSRLASRAVELQATIWGQAVAAAPRCQSDQAAALALASLNEMFDAANRHQVAYGAHTPTLILLLVLVVGMLCGLLVGHDMGARGPVNWLHTLVFAAVVSLTIWVIYDLEMPRFGLIRVDDYDRLLRDLRDEFSRNVSEPGTAAGAPREPAEASPADDGGG